MRSGAADVLVGTQLVAKGLDLPNVTTVGVVNADTSLHFPDYRSAERTFSLLTQVAGRAGRGSAASQVFIQTYTPDHPAVDRKSTRLNSSHSQISYAVFCLKKKN